MKFKCVSHCDKISFLENGQSQIVISLKFKGANDDDDFEQDDDIVSAHESIWENEESGIIVSW